MRLRDYLADHIAAVGCLAAAELLLAGLLWLIGTPWVFIGFAAGIVALAAAAALGWDYARRRAWYGRLLARLDALDQKTLLGEIADEPDFLDGRLLCGVLRRCNKYQNDRLAEAERRALDYREYLDGWVHEIKTPITSARLIAENDKTPAVLRMDDELRRIELLVEQVLYYARSGDAEKDFRVERTTLRALVADALKRWSRPLIQAGGRPVLENLDLPVTADAKSCGFVLGQILSNAVKYRSGPLELRFTGARRENAVTLTIADNGIGIPPSDLARVFDKGFTGQNGRLYPRATGIGLYLCRRLCSQMNMGIAAESAPGRGTALTLTFPAESHIPAD